MATVTQTVDGTSIVQFKPSYCTIDDFRNETGLVEADISSDELQLVLNEATWDIRHSAYQKVEFEFVSADSYGRYWLKYKYPADFNSSAGTVTLADIEVYEAETVSSVGATLGWGWRGVNINFIAIADKIKSVDTLNSFFTLQPGYPTQSRLVYVTYWFASKPIDKIQTELRWACLERATVIALKRIWTRLLKKGTTTMTLGKKTLTRDMNAFNNLIEGHQKKYEYYINYIKPFYGRSMKVGRGELIPFTPFQLPYN